VLIDAQGNGGKVPRQLYHDLSARWRPSGSAGANDGLLNSFLANVEVSGGIRNVFGKLPPVDVSNGFSFYSYLGDVRMRTYYLQLKYAF
jgi:outer membrane receptor protein involved in Fe transport